MLTKPKTQKGLSLVESMIALLVISIGLLGIAALQLTAMGQNSSALNHSQAVWIAYNMTDRIRANLPEYLNYNGIDTNNAYSQECLNTNCSNAQMLVADATDWQTLVGTLPGGRGIIGSNADGLLVTVMWDDDGTGATGTGCNPAVATDLTCYTMVVAR